MFKSTIGVLTIGLIAMLSMSNMGGRAKQGGEGNTGAPGDKSFINVCAFILLVFNCIIPEINCH